MKAPAPPPPALELTGQHFDDDKLRIELVPPELIYAVAHVLTYGARKYAPNNWLGGMDWSRLMGSVERHYYAWKTGEDVDPESGLSHLAHAATDLAFLITYAKRELGNDDRRKTQEEKASVTAKDRHTNPSSAGGAGYQLTDAAERMFRNTHTR